MYFFFNDTATTEIYTLSLHDALPIYKFLKRLNEDMFAGTVYTHDALGTKESFDATTGEMLRQFYRRWYAPNNAIDRKSTRLNSSHSQISYAVFCLKKKSPSTYTTSHI